MPKLPWLIGWRIFSRSSRLNIAIIVLISFPIMVCLVLFSVVATSVVQPTELRSWVIGKGEYRVTLGSNFSVEAINYLQTILEPKRVLLDADVEFRLNNLSNSGNSVTAPIAGRFLDLTNPLAQGIYQVAEGSPQSCKHEVCLAPSIALAEKLQIRPGDTVQIQLVPGSTVSAVVAATIYNPRELNRQTFTLWGIDCTPQSLVDNASGGIRWITGSLDASTINTLFAHGYRVSTGDELMRSMDMALPKPPPTLIVVGILIFALFILAAAVVQFSGLRHSFRSLKQLGASRWMLHQSLLVYAFLCWVAGVALATIVGLGFVYLIRPVVRTVWGQDWGSPTVAWEAYSASAILTLLTLSLGVLLASYESENAKTPFSHRNRILKLSDFVLLSGGLTAAIVPMLWVTPAGVFICVIGVMAFLLVLPKLLIVLFPNATCSAHSLLAARSLRESSSVVHILMVLVGFLSLATSAITWVSLDTAESHSQIAYFDAVPESTVLIGAESTLDQGTVQNILEQSGMAGASFKLLYWPEKSLNPEFVKEHPEIEMVQIEETEDFKLTDPVSQVGVVNSVADLELILGHEPSNKQVQSFLHGDGVRLLPPGVKSPTTTRLIVPDGIDSDRTLYPALEPDYGYFWYLPKLVVSPQRAQSLGTQTEKYPWNYLLLRSPVKQSPDLDQLYTLLKDVPSHSVITPTHQEIISGFSQVAWSVYGGGGILILTIIFIVSFIITKQDQGIGVFLYFNGANQSLIFRYYLAMTSIVTLPAILAGAVLSVPVIVSFSRYTGMHIMGYHLILVVPILIAGVLDFFVSWRASREARDSYMM